MRILIDGESVQALVHDNDGVRLRDAIGALRLLGATVEISPRGRALQSDVLAEQDVVLIPTRSPSSLAFSAVELDAIEGFVARGGGLLLMTNHGSTERIPDLTVHDRSLAARFGVVIEPSVFCRGRPEPIVAAALGMDPVALEASLAARRTLGDLADEAGVALEVVLDALHVVIGSTWLEEHPVTVTGGPMTRGVCFTNSAGLTTASGTVLAWLPHDLVDIGRALRPEGYAFAVALDGGRGEVRGDGRVVMVADSGFIGSRGTSFPGPGLVDRSDNTRFLMNIVRWLSRDGDL